MAKVHFKLCQWLNCALVGPQGPMAVFLVRKGRPKQVGRFMLHGRFAREALGFNVVLVFQACNVVHVSRRLTANPISMLCFSMACTAPTAHQASPVDRGRPRQTKAQDFSHGCTDGPTLSTLVARPGAPSSFLLLVAMPAPSSALIDGFKRPSVVRHFGPTYVIAVGSTDQAAPLLQRSVRCLPLHLVVG